VTNADGRTERKREEDREKCTEKEDREKGRGARETRDQRGGVASRGMERRERPEPGQTQLRVPERKICNYNNYSGADNNYKSSLN